VIDLQLGATGVTIEADLGVDVSDATSITFYFCNPNQATVTHTGTFVTDGTDGLVQCVTTGDEVDLDGVWSLQVKVTTTAGVYPSIVSIYRVRDNLY
jgi:hypothetical protein